MNSLGDERPFLRPILRLFSPRELVNWQVDQDGQLSYVLFYDLEVLGNEWVWKWYEIDRSQYAEYVKPVDSEEREEPVLLAQANHGFGFVPVVVSYSELVEPMIGKSYLQESAVLDLKKFIQEADLEFDRFMLAHPQMVVKATEEIGSIEVDASKYLKLSPEEDAAYIQLDRAPFEVTAEAIKQTRMDIARKLRVDPLGFVVQEGKVELSGIARQLSYALHQSDTLTSVSEVAEEAETEILRMAFEIMENEANEDVSAAYEKDFSLSSIDTQMQVYKELGEDIPSETFKAEMLTRFAKAMVGNNPSVNEEIEEEIKQGLEERKQAGEELQDQDAEDEQEEEAAAA